LQNTDDNEGFLKKGETNYIKTVNSQITIICERFSSMLKLLRVTALVLKFIRKLRREKVESDISSTEIQEAETMWRKYVQEKQRTQLRFSKNKYKFKKELRIFLWIMKVFKMPGRLENAGLEEGAKRSNRSNIVTIKGSFYSFSDRKYTQRLLTHSGVTQTLARIRYRFWIPKGRSTVKSLIRLCLICRRWTIQNATNSSNTNF
jgi:hypothetical protein